MRAPKVPLRGMSYKEPKLSAAPLVLGFATPTIKLNGWLKGPSARYCKRAAKGVRIDQAAATARARIVEVLGGPVAQAVAGGPVPGLG